MKVKRQSKILELVKNNCIETQEELISLLEVEGFVVTQATASRDIRELRLVKAADDQGKLKYVVQPNLDNGFNERLKNIFNEGFLGISHAQNMLVIKTAEGMGMAVATALDAMSFDEILGSIGGEDIIICVAKSEEAAKMVIEKVNNMWNS